MGRRQPAGEAGGPQAGRFNGFIFIYFLFLFLFLFLFIFIYF